MDDVGLSQTVVAGYTFLLPPENSIKSGQDNFWREKNAVLSVQEHKNYM